MSVDEGKRRMNSLSREGRVCEMERFEVGETRGGGRPTGLEAGMRSRLHPSAVFSVVCDVEALMPYPLNFDNRRMPYVFY